MATFKSKRNAGGTITAGPKGAERLRRAGFEEIHDDGYDDLSKPELVELAETRGVDSTGTKADIAGRLRQQDDES